MTKMKGYVIDMRHDFTSEPKFAVRQTLDEAVEVSHNFFLLHGFKLKNGKPFDDGNDNGKNGGFDCFDNVKMHNGKILTFMHCGGDGPCCSVKAAS